MEKICIKTFGCSLNNADSERMAAILQEKGFQIIEDIDKADVIILNSCAVKGPTESKFFTFLEKLKAENRKVIVAGCIAQAMPEKLDEFSKIGPDQVDAIGDVVDETLADNVVSMLVQERKNKLKIPSIRKNKFIEIIPTGQGCLGQCAYCITRVARGELHSYPEEDILELAKKAIKEGVKEIWLTSQDNGCYGFDINTNIASLMRKINDLEGNFMVRVGMMNPNHALRILDKLIDAFALPKIYKFIHLPVQSGNNFVLEDMKRQYHIEDFVHILKKFKKKIPEMTVSTDIIVGYPTEKEEFFLDSINMIKEVKPDVLNISKFWPRPHTEASKLKMLPGEILKKRAIEMMQTHDWIAFNNNKNWIQWQGKVLVTEKGKENTFIGRNFAYKQVIITEKVELGKEYTVRITNNSKHDLLGKIITI
jgi:MiaB-like tRNA modifying enzyme